MIRSGRAVLAVDEDKHTAAWNFWRQSLLLSKALLEPAEAVPGAQMRVIEDVSEDSVPSTTSLTHTASAAEKFCQLGIDAYTSLAAQPARSCVLIVDLFAHAGDLASAMLKEQFTGSLKGLRMVYLGFHATDMEAE